MKKERRWSSYGIFLCCMLICLLSIFTGIFGADGGLYFILNMFAAWVLSLILGIVEGYKHSTARKWLFVPFVYVYELIYQIIFYDGTPLFYLLIANPLVGVVGPCVAGVLIGSFVRWVRKRLDQGKSEVETDIAAGHNIDE